MTTMLRFGSVLMMVLLTASIVRDCCVPVVHEPPCHQSNHKVSVACSSDPQAVAESKNPGIIKASIESEWIAATAPCLPALLNAYRAICAADGAGPPITDIYLRTSALLI